MKVELRLLVLMLMFLFLGGSMPLSEGVEKRYGFVIDNENPIAVDDPDGTVFGSLVGFRVADLPNCEFATGIVFETDEVSLFCPGTVFETANWQGTLIGVVRVNGQLMELIVLWTRRIADAPHGLFV